MKAAVTVKENHVFRRIYRKGRSSVQPCLVVYCQRSREGKTRLGVTVSTKLGKAVVRNRVRRQLRELYRLHLGQMKPGNDVIIVGRVKAVHTPYRKMEVQYLRALKELGLLREDGQ